MTSARLARTLGWPRLDRQRQRGNSGMWQRLKRLAIASVLIPLTSCETIGTAAQRTDHAILNAVPCPELPPIIYHAPRNATEIVQWQAGRLVDTSNTLDTPETVEAVRKFNAARDAVCGTR